MDEKLYSLIETTLLAGISREHVCKHASISRKVELKYTVAPFNYRKVLVITSIIVLLIAMKTPDVYQQPRTFWKGFLADNFFSFKDSCMLQHTPSSIEITRPIAKCSLCKGLTQVMGINGVNSRFESLCFKSIIS